MNVLVLVFLVDVVVVGTGLTYLSGLRLDLEERVGLGVLAGTIAVTALTFVAAFAFGFGVASLATGTLAASLLSVPGWRRGAAGLGAEWRDLVRRLRLRSREARSARPLAAVTLASWVVTARILQLAYQSDGKGGIVAGHLSTYGDWNAHLAYAGSFVAGDNIPPQLPFAVGEKLSYHVGVNVFAADLAVLRAPLTTSLVLSSGLLALAVPLVFSFAGQRFTSRRSVTLLAYLLFTLSGGLGFVFAFVDVARGGLGVLGNLPRTYALLPEHHIWMDNAVTAFLYAQRPGLVGLPLVLAVVAIVWSGRDEPSRRPWVVAGVLAGVSPGFSGFGYVTALLIAGYLALRHRRLAAFFVPALGLGLPVLVALEPSTSALRWEVGWMAPRLGVPWPWFWLMNLGLFLPLALVALVRRRPVLATGFDRAVALPVWLLFVVMNLVAVHPWDWNNTHYLIVWLLFSTFPVAGLLVAGFERAGARRALAVAAVPVLLASGGLDIWRAVDGSAFHAGLTSADGLAAANWAREETSARAVFLTAPFATEPIPSFGARRVVSGNSGWVFDLGVADWYRRAEDIGRALRGEPGTDEILARYGVDYVVIGPLERGEPYRASQAYWDARGTLVFANGEYRIYRVGLRSPSGGDPGPP